MDGGPPDNGGLEITEQFFANGADEICANVETACEPAQSGAKWEIVGSPTVQDFVDQSSACFVQGRDGKAYLIGGYKKNPVCRYDPNLRTWECNSDESTSEFTRVHHSQCVVIGDEIWFVVGWGNRFDNDESTIQDNGLPVVQVYNYILDQWELKTGLDESRYRAGAAVAHFNGTIFVSHGSVETHDTGASLLLDSYDIATDTWTSLPDASFARDHTGGSIVNGEFCVTPTKDSAPGNHNARHGLSLRANLCSHRVHRSGKKRRRPSRLCD